MLALTITSREIIDDLDAPPDISVTPKDIQALLSAIEVGDGGLRRSTLTTISEADVDSSAEPVAVAGKLVKKRFRSRAQQRRKEANAVSQKQPKTDETHSVDDKPAQSNSTTDAKSQASEDCGARPTSS
jgi:hypothetical protein